VALPQQPGRVPTADEHLLERQPERSQGFIHTDTWRALRIQAEFVEGFDALAELGPAVSVFGSARVRARNPDYRAARALGRAGGAPPAPGRAPAPASVPQPPSGD